ncbi:hypothetical protein NLG97_g3903 [Lecanicillium saksenae]|uniref:Uncharacterized protein n=1 Tax=Lecanicillium saksenae TaxID=468837 RepID=A0ACC1QX09_9HYPO|nr:hypothetical protein NLG97_g3903 [Lecanicillium saksenae]
MDEKSGLPPYAAAAAVNGYTPLPAPGSTGTRRLGRVRRSRALKFFTLGSGKVTVPGSDLNYAPNGDGNCVGGIATLNGLDISIFGDVALKSGFVVYDDANNRLGWAKGK